MRLVGLPVEMSGELGIWGVLSVGSAPRKRRIVAPDWSGQPSEHTRTGGRTLNT